MRDELNQVDVGFVVDTTGSMVPFLQAARAHLIDAMRALSGSRGVDLHVGLVEYRDHPPEERTFVTRAHPLTGNLRTVQRTIAGLAALGGGDVPEAVYDGVRDTCTQLRWRPHSLRFALLVGDAPPHGAAAEEREDAPTGRGRRNLNGDRGAGRCPCGLTARAVAAAAESEAITLHALCMSNVPGTLAAFGRIAASTGGQCVAASQARQVIERMVEVLSLELRGLELDRQVLDAARRLRCLEVSELAGAVGAARLPAAAAVARLGRRGFLADLGG